MRKSEIRKKLAKAADLPETAFGNCPYIEIEGNGSVKIDRCLEILSYESDRAELQLAGMKVIITGKELMLRSYGTKAIKLSGEIIGVTLEKE